MKIYDFNSVEVSVKKYGGMAGSKLGIVLNNEYWFLKFPQSTKGFNNIEVSYTTSPLSEYIGSHIYASVGIPTHETKLGIKDKKLVVACKDFNSNDKEFYHFAEVKNEYVSGLEEKLEKLSSSGLNTDINELIIIFKNNPTFKKNKDLESRFWDMFVVDALIGNNDRNNGNWGIFIHNSTKEITLAPVYDNGASFSNKVSDERLNEMLNDEQRFVSNAYLSLRTIFYDDGKIINPLKYMEQTNNQDLIDAIKRMVPKINLKDIKEIIYELPNEENGIYVISDIRKEFYYKVIEYRYNHILLPLYNTLNI